MSNFSLFLKYARYLLSAQTRHGIHSPFVYSLLENIILDETPYYIYGSIEKIRSGMLADKSLIKVTDYGAGSSAGTGSERRIADIAALSLKSKKYGQLLFRLVNYFKPPEIIELGTSLGISSMYLAAPHPGSKVYTIEGCPEIAAKAKSNFAKINASNIYSFTGTFEKFLPEILSA
jgi:hypothetical protein